MDIAIIGAGSVGSALGGSFSRVGHQVYYGLRNPQDAKYAALRQESAGVLTVGQAAGKARVVVLAVPWPAVRDTIASCGDLAGKIVIDCTNPIKADFSGLEIGHTTSAGEVVASLATGARVVKCFNHTSFENMADSAYGALKPVLFAAGDDQDAVKTVAGLAREIGFEAVEMKGLDRARQLEQLAWLWIDLAAKQGQGRNFAFALLRR